MAGEFFPNYPQSPQPETDFDFFVMPTINPDFQGALTGAGDLFGMFMSYQLDRRRPLWEMWYVDGVVGDQVALVTKFHHCLMDGASGAGLARRAARTWGTLRRWP